MFKLLAFSLRELLSDFLSPSRHIVRFWGRFGCLKPILLWFPLSKFYTNRHGVQRFQLQPFVRFADLTDQEEVVSELREFGCSRVFHIGSAALDIIRHAAENGQFSQVDSDGDGLFSIQEILNNATPPGKFVLVNQNEFPDLLSLGSSEPILTVAQSYLGRVDYISVQVTVIKYPDANDCKTLPDHTVGWHYDLDANKFLKLFTYISFGEDAAGSHYCATGTHRDRGMFDWLFRRRKHSHFSNSSIREFEFSEGACFFEDTFAYHKAGMGRGVRGLISINFMR